MDDERIFQRFREVLDADRAAGRVRRLAVYCRMFPGHDEAIARAYADVEGHVGTESPPPAAPPTPAASDSELSKAIHATGSRRYADGNEIARGGMGAIRRVHDEKLRRVLAMKVMLDPPSDVERSRDRFVAEARVTAQLDHPGVVPIHDLGVDDAGRVYFTMKLVGGRTLTHVFADVRRGVRPWTRARAVEILIRVCETLAFAHSRGVIHRDVKPDNVMVGDFGEVYVMDWGLAKTTGTPAAPSTAPAATASASISDDPRAAGQTSVVGTPAYMPPEQAAGVPADARSDVYAVGAMLYQLLAGAAPYGESDPSPSPAVVLKSLAAGPPAPVATLAPDAQEELVAIVERAMARDPAGRYPDAVAMAEDLRRFVEGRVVRAHSTGAVVELTKWVKRNRALATAIGVAIALLVAGLVTNHLLLVDSRREAELARRQAFRAGMRGAQASLAAGDVAAAGARLAEIDPAARSWEWRVLDARLDEATRILDACDARFDAEGRVWAIDRTGAIVRGRPDGGALEVVVPAARGALIEVAPDARWAVVDPTGKANAGFRVVALPSGDEIAAFGGHEMLGWSIDSTRGWITSLDNRTHSVRVFDLETGRNVASRQLAANSVLQTRSAPPSGTPWPDGLVAIDADGREIELLDAGTLATVARLRGHGDYAFAVAISPHEPVVVTAAADKTARAWRLAPDPTLLWTHDAGLRVRHVAIAPDGRRVFALLDDGSLAILRAADGAVLRALHDRRGGRHAYTPRESIVFSPDGRWAASPRGDETAVWDASDDRDSRVLVGHASFVYDVAFSPDGARLASVGWDGWAGRSGGIRVWDAATGEQIVALGAQDASFTTVAWSADGAHLYATSGSGRNLEDKRVHAFDATTGAEIAEFGRPAHAVATSRTGRTAVVAGVAGEVPILAVVDPRNGATATWSAPSDYVGEPVAWVGPDRVATVDDADVVVVRAASGREARVDLKGHTDRVWGIAVSSDAARILTASDDGTVREWDVATGAQLALMRGQGPGALCAAYSPDGSRIVTGGRDRLVHVWDAATHEEIVSFAGHRGYVKDVAFSPDGATLASASEDGTVRLWSPEPLPVRQRARRERARLVEMLRLRVLALFAGADDGADAVAGSAVAAVAALRADGALRPEEREVALQLVLSEAVARRTGISSRR